MKNIIALLSCFIVFTACSSDSNDDNQNNISNTKLIKEVQLDLISNTSKTIDYTYNGDILTQTIETSSSNSDVYKTVYNYSNNLITNLNFLKNNIANGSETYEYDNDEKIISSISTKNGITERKAYAYNVWLIAIQDIVNSQVNSSIGIQTHNSLPNGTNSKTETYYNSSSTMVQKIDYVSDVQNHPYLNMFPKAYVDIKLKFSVNNILTKTMLNGDVYNYEYTYSGHKPNQVIEKLNGVPKTKTTYIYQ